MSQAIIKPRRPLFAYNRVVKALADLYDQNYNDVMKIYRGQNDNIEYTKMILNLKSNA